MNFTGLNVVSNPIANASDWTGPPVSAGDPGVQLIVGAGVPANGFIQVSQMNSVRQDLLFGTYRALLKITAIPGTCTSFFWVSILCHYGLLETEANYLTVFQRFSRDRLRGLVISVRLPEQYLSHEPRSPIPAIGSSRFLFDCQRQLESHQSSFRSHRRLPRVPN
jgi:hypothetical protein